MVLEYLGIGLSLGVTAGLSPGPLMALVISETVKGGRIRGIKVSLAPLFTDIPLILAIIFLLKHIKNIHPLLGVISLVGSLLLFYFGYKDLKTDKINLQTGNIQSDSSFRKGLVTNFLNPHPYVFWLFIGVPFMLKGNSIERTTFVLSFLSGIIGSKICLTLIVEKGRKFIETKYYLRIIKSLGLILMFFGLLLLKDGIGYLLR
jgi:threonine/homoserine/homoserine lactone efflux protein